MSGSEPALAAWLVEVFAPPDESDAILGDLREEFTELVARTGTRAARRWYWRHALTTAVSLTIGGLRARPGMMAATGFISLAATMPLFQITDELIKLVVRNFPVYHYVSAPSFWLVATMIPFVATGFGVALAVRRQPMAAAVAVALTIAVISAVDMPLVALWYGSLPIGVHSPLQLLTRWLRALVVFDLPVLFGALLSRALGVHGLRRAPST